MQMERHQEVVQRRTVDHRGADGGTVSGVRRRPADSRRTAISSAAERAWGPAAAAAAAPRPAARRSITGAAVETPSATTGPSSAGAAIVGHAQLNEHRFREHNAYAVEMYGYISNGVRLTAEAWEVLKQADEIGNARNWDNSDSMTDYFDVNYYFDLHIGKWNQPFVRLAPAPAETHTEAPCTIAGATIVQDRDWVWITFATKPAEDVIERLRSLGARWSKRRSAWYLTDSGKAGELAGLAA